MLIKVKRECGSILYFDSARVLYLFEKGTQPDNEWPQGMVAKVMIDAEGAKVPLFFPKETWSGVRILLGIDTAVMVEATA